MARAINEERRTLHFDPQLGWVEQETPNAKYRMQSLWRMTTSGLVDNELYQVNHRGGWDPMPLAEQARLAGHEAGYVFTVKPRQGQDGTYLEITSVRYVDEAMASGLLDGLRLFDRDLRPLDGPELAVDVFCIPSVQAEVFFGRVRQRGGVIMEAQADLQAMHARLGRLQHVIAEMEQLCQMSRAVIDQLATTGVQTDVPSIGERSRTMHMLRDQASQVVGQLRDEKIALDRQVGQMEQQAHADAYVSWAEQAMQRVEQLHREHRSYEVQGKMRIMESLSQSLPAADSPGTTMRYLFTPVVEFYTDRGFDCQLTNDGMILRLGDVVVELSQQPVVRTPDRSVTADQLTGRRTADRGQREL